MLGGSTEPGLRKSPKAGNWYGVVSGTPLTTAAEGFCAEGTSCLLLCDIQGISPFMGTVCNLQTKDGT